MDNITLPRYLVEAMESEIIDMRREKQCVDCSEWDITRQHEYLTHGFCPVKGRETIAEDGCREAEYEKLALCIRSGQVPDEDLPAIFADEVFTRWYRLRYGVAQ